MKKIKQNQDNKLENAKREFLKELSYEKTVLQEKIERECYSNGLAIGVTLGAFFAVIIIAAITVLIRL
jgi:hypothetical protein